MTDRTEAVLRAAGLEAETIAAVLRGNAGAQSRSLEWPPRRAGSGSEARADMGG